MEGFFLCKRFGKSILYMKSNYRLKQPCITAMSSPEITENLLPDFVDNLIGLILDLKKEFKQGQAVTETITRLECDLSAVRSN